MGALFSRTRLAPFTPARRSLVAFVRLARFPSPRCLMVACARMPFIPFARLAPQSEIRLILA